MPRDQFIVRLGKEPRRLYQALLCIDCIREFVGAESQISVLSLRDLTENARNQLTSRGVSLLEYERPLEFFRFASGVEIEAERVVLLSPVSLLGSPITLGDSKASIGATPGKAPDDWPNTLKKARLNPKSPFFDLRLIVAERATWRDLNASAAKRIDPLTGEPDPVADDTESLLSTAFSLAVADLGLPALSLGVDYAVVSNKDNPSEGANPFAFILLEHRRFDFSIRPLNFHRVLRLESRIRSFAKTRIMDGLDPESYWDMIYDPGTPTDYRLPYQASLPEEEKERIVGEVLKATRDSSVLDFGAGPAEYMRGKQVSSYTAVDVSDAALQLAASAVPDAKLVRGYAHEYEGGQADVVLCFDVLQTLASRERYEATVRRAIEATRKTLVLSGYCNPSPEVSGMGPILADRYYESVQDTVKRLAPRGEVTLIKSSDSLGIVRWDRPRTLLSLLGIGREKALSRATPESEFTSFAMIRSYPRPPVGPKGPKLLIYGAGRTGSTALRRILSQHPDVRAANEPFWSGNAHEVSASHLPTYSGKVLEHPQDFERILGELWTEFNLVKHVVNYAGWPFVHSYPFNRLMLVREGQAILFLTRENLLRRSVSEYIARQTGDWIDGKGEVWDFEPMPIIHYADPLPLTKAMEVKHRKWLDDAGVPYMEATYEWFFDREVGIDERAKRIRAVLEYAGFDPEGLTLQDINKSLSGTEKGIRGEDTYRRIPNYREIDEELGSDEFGWLIPPGEENEAKP